MAFRATDLKLVLEEIAPALIEGWIQKIYQPATRVVVFEFRARGATYRLLVSCEPETARLHLGHIVRGEIVAQLGHLRRRGTEFVVPIPSLEVVQA